MKEFDNDIQFKLSQLLDGQLSPREAKALRQQIEADAELAEEFRLYQALEGQLGDQAQHVPGMAEGDWQDQRANLRAALEREALLAAPAPRLRLRMPKLYMPPARIFRWASTVTAAAAAIVVAVLIWRPYEGPGVPGIAGPRAPGVVDRNSNAMARWEPPVPPIKNAGPVTSSLVAPARSSRAMANVMYNAEVTLLVETEGPTAVSAFNTPIDGTGTVAVVEGGGPDSGDSGGPFDLGDL